tara:strand:+ start:17319 stop:18131 length:813 start_codon:yes stop_codon:yes gene_type:complete
MHYRLLSFLSLLITVLSAPAYAQSGHLTLTGSSTVAPLVTEIAKRFEKTHSGTRIDVQTGGSARGINDARSGLSDIGMVSRALKASENDLTAYTIAMDGIGIILHKENGIKKLTNDQIIHIYIGQINNWKNLGGRDLPITVVNKAEGRSTLELFLKYFSLKNSQIKPSVIIGDNQQGIKTVSGNIGAIGYVSIGTAEYEIKSGASIKLLPIMDIEATTENVKNGTFPLSRPLNLVAKNTSSLLLNKFIQYAQSQEVYDLVEAQFFVPVEH